MKTKKKKIRPRRNRGKIALEIKQRLIDKLAELAEGLTPPEIVKAHVDFYYTCNMVEREMLLLMFKADDDRMSTEICQFYTEKHYG